jgi:hypothetical protein
MRPRYRTKTIQNTRERMLGVKCISVDFVFRSFSNAHSVWIIFTQRSVHQIKMCL